MKPLFLLFICFVVAPFYVGADWPIHPQNNQKKKKIAYYEGGSYESYNRHLVWTVRHLMDLGWIPPAPLPTPEDKTAQAIWQFFANELKSDYVEFVANGFYSARWDPDTANVYRMELLERLNNNEFDLLWAMGTRAGKAFATNEHSTPTVVRSTSDAIAAGIVKSAEDSGFDHVHARVNPYKFEDQIRWFHEFVKFKKLGLPFLNDEVGRSYAAYDIVARLSQELGYELVECHIPFFGSDFEKSAQAATDCVQKLAPQVDAIYLTEMDTLKKRNMHNLVPIFLKYKIPTLTQFDDGNVKRGVLMSISRSNQEDVTRFSAQSIAKILNGAKPRDLEQVYRSPLKVSLNLKTAQEIGFDVPHELLEISETIYHEIEP